MSQEGKASRLRATAALPPRPKRRGLRATIEDSRDGLVPVGSVEGNRGCSAVFLGSDEE